MSPPESERRYSPTLMVHGLGANHRAFHFPDRSLANWLADRGHDLGFLERP